MIDIAEIKIGYLYELESQTTVFEVTEILEDSNQLVGNIINSSHKSKDEIHNLKDIEFIYPKVENK